jgi:putative transposase
MVTPAARRTVAAYLSTQHGLSQRRACRLTQLARSTARYRSRRAEQSELRQRLRTLAVARPRFGYRRLGILLRRELGMINHKRVYRLYQAEGLSVRRRRRKRVTHTNRPYLPVPTRVGQHWAMDFTHDGLASGRTFRTLNLIDRFSRECLAIEADTSLPAARVVRVLERVIGAAANPRAFGSTIGQSLLVRCLTPGRTSTRSHSTLRRQASQPRTAISRASMANFVTSA